MTVKAKAVEGWKRRDPKNIHLLGEGSKSDSVIAWERERGIHKKHYTGARFTIYPAISISETVHLHTGEHTGYAVLHWACCGGKIKYVETLEEAVETATKYMSRYK